MSPLFSTECPADLTAAVTAAGIAAVRLSACGPLRKSPPSYPGVELSGHFLKHADEQTIVALLALRQATDRYHIDPRELAGWGIIAAPRYIGRLTGANVIYKFPRGGTSGVAPHIVAQCSLHSVSGAASIALGMHGPNVGVGGGEWAIADGLAAALTLFETQSVPGVWLLLSEFDAEPIPDQEGKPQNDPTCHAVALALEPGQSGQSQLTLRPGSHEKSLHANYPEPTVAELAACIDAAHRGLASRWACWLPWGGRAELRLAAAELGLAKESSPQEAALKAA
jgi:hypothetical protein